MDDGLAYSHERAGGEDRDGRQPPTGTDKSPNGRDSHSHSSSSTTGEDTGHRRSLSGGLLSRLSFLSPVQGHGSGAIAELAPAPHDDEAEKKGDATTAGWQQQQKKPRRRKGSLRKTALLGTGKMRLEGREWRERPESGRTGYGAQRQHQEQQPHSKPTGVGGDVFGDGADGDSSSSAETTPTQNSFRNEAVPSPPSPPSPPSSSCSSSGQWPLRIKTNGNGTHTNGKPPSSTKDQNNNTDNNFSSLPPIATSPTPADTSTTDDEDVLTFPRHPLSSTPVTLLPAPPGRKPSFGDGGSGTVSSLSRRKSGNVTGAKNKENNPSTTPTTTPPPATSGTTTTTSPLSSASPTTPLIPPLTITPPTPSPTSEWDYAETAWWGWVVLTTTWLVFVVGMGSCLGVWSWAWDVGETPYAPPELEDDPTLPITGYYPALMILTGVMAWVWVVVAWIGMKYFRHAKISGEDG
ncbi:MAG: hypothetical protein M1840_006587 [Geoglossum simile]|nr:MAG: hypothetical protein M1840_006587 [Geoglossum simile]